MRFVKESEIAASAERVFAFHEAKGAFERLLPPWQTAEVVKAPASLAVGTRVVVRLRFGPLWQTLEAEHVAYEKGRLFEDRLVRGPFRAWHHRHLVTPLGPARCRLTDDISFELPLGLVGRVIGGPVARHGLERLFRFRHEVTRAACESNEPL